MSDPSLIHHKQIEQYPVTSTGSTSLPDEASHLDPWLRYYGEGVPTTLSIPDHALTWLLDSTASRYPAQLAFIYYGTRITYAQFSHQVDRFANALQQLGVQKGDRVAVALPNIPQFGIAFYGALKAGAIVVPTNPLYTAPEMQHQLADAGAKVLVMLDMYYPVVRAVRSQTSLEHVIVTGITDFFPSLQRTLYPLTQLRSKKRVQPLTPDELRKDSTLHQMHPMLIPSTHKGGVELFNLPAPAHGDDVAVLQYTGGTTGLAKGAMLTHRNLLANALQTFHWVPQAHRGQEVALCVAPFFHAYGLTVAMNLSIAAAATMVLLPRFKAKEAVEAIHHYRPTLFPGIPTMYVAIIREAARRQVDLKSIKYCISGAAPLPAKVQRDFEELTNGKLVEGYGLSEAAPVTHCNPLTDQCRNGSIGLPLPGIEAAIISGETGASLPPGEVGELVVKGPNIMRGYWHNPTETQAIFVDGWMHTGDVAKMDEEGFFYIVERAKDMIIASGFNIYPREVEEVLFNHAAIADVAVAGLPDSYRGETVAAFVVLKEGITPSDTLKQEIQDFCKRSLASYKVPKIIHFRRSLPRSLVGKVLRRELRTNPEADRL